MGWLKIETSPGEKTTVLVDVEQGEVLAGLAGLEVRPLQHDDQPLLLLLGNLNKRHILAFRIYCKRICRIMHLWRGGLFDKLSLLSSNLALFSHHMDRGSEVREAVIYVLAEFVR